MNKLVSKKGYPVKFMFILTLAAVFSFSFQSKGEQICKHHFYADIKTTLKLIGNKSFNHQVDTLEKQAIDFSKVLLIVDGVKTSATFMNGLSPTEIRHVIIFTEKQAVSMFGDEGKNGAMIIQTKAGNHKDANTPKTGKDLLVVKKNNVGC